MLLLVLLLYIFFASSFTFSKASMLYMMPLSFTAIRMIIAGVILLIYQYFFDKSQFKFERKHYWLFLKLSFFAIFLSYSLEFLSIEYVVSSKVALLFNLSPFITALISFFLFSERLSTKQIIGLSIGFIGILPMIGTTVASESIEGVSFGFLSLPEIMLIVAIIAACYGWTLFKLLVSRYKYSPVMVNGISMIIGGMIASVFSLGKEGFAIVRMAPYGETVFNGFIVDPFYVSLVKGFFYMAVLIVVGNIISYNLYGYLLKKYSATFISFAGFITPLFTAVFGWFLLGESITWHFFASLIITLCGLYLFYCDELLLMRKIK